MRKLLIPLVSAGSLLFVAAAANAGEGCGGAKTSTTAAQKIFEKADTDGSGTLTPAEYSAAEMERFGVEFVEYDLDSNGEASMEEYLELFERHHSGTTDFEA